MLLEVPVRLSIACLLTVPLGASLAGCDRQKAAQEQGAAPTAPAPAAAAPRPVQGLQRLETGWLSRAHAGTLAPSTSFVDGDGKPLTLARFRGKPTLVNLWATWCAPCLKEMPTLDALAAQRKGRLNVVAVSQDDRDGEKKVAAYLVKHPLKSLEPYIDTRTQLTLDSKSANLPTTILYDAQGREVWRIEGREDWMGEKPQALLDATAGKL
jgi:thiol-disulfide isomerase/thioredoxin